MSLGLPSARSRSARTVIPRDFSRMSSLVRLQPVARPVASVHSSNAVITVRIVRSSRWSGRGAAESIRVTTGSNRPGTSQVRREGNIYGDKRASASLPADDQVYETAAGRPGPAGPGRGRLGSGFPGHLVGVGGREWGGSGGGARRARRETVRA